MQALQPVSGMTLEGDMMAREWVEAVPLLVYSDGIYPRVPRFPSIEDNPMLWAFALPVLRARSGCACPALVERPQSSSDVGLKS